MSEKKYLVSGLKDGQEYFYKDLEAHGKVDSLQDNVSDLKADFLSLSGSVSSALNDKVSSKTFNELSKKVEEITIPEIDYSSIESKISSAVEEAKENVLNLHNVSLEDVKKEIKRFHHQGQSFEIKHAPAGTLVDYNSKEIRIFCPLDTDWVAYDNSFIKKNFETNTDDYRFIEFCAYAPEGAKTYKEKVTYECPPNLYGDEEKEPISYSNDDENLESGIDENERKYSLYYFPVAVKENGGWIYLGSKSTDKDYNGWYYTIEWYDSDILGAAKLLKSSTIRVNLASDENNFRYIEPSYEHSVWDLVRKTLPKYEISGLPEGAICKERDKELRVYCLPETNWQESPNTNQEQGGLTNQHYMTFKAYAPDSAVYFKEDLDTQITDENFYRIDTGVSISDSSKKTSVGIDKYGRKYSMAWLALAIKNSDWLYYGDNSTDKHYIGHDYTVEWYDKDKKLIDTDCIRVNIVKDLAQLRDRRSHMEIEIHRYE